ncbi:GntR family transcriptional regulator [Kineococcus glutinatus]|uniref:GntR family transcriptional regulator n=1 Tax=Kineococcus glutinatus TaxID=1070872 RepID=A0ABP9HPA2_9ACTN
MAVEPLPSLDRSTLRERALVAVRSAILTGRYGPGDHLGEVELAGSLGVSRGTVREALRHLQQEGLVVAGARGMLRVRALSPQEVRELFAVRAALEGLAISELIASPRRQEAAARLRAELERLEEDPDDVLASLEADLGFHLLLCQLAGNSMLVDAWRHLEGRMRVTIMSFGETTAKGLMSAQRHLPIVEAVERGEVPAARAVIEAHMAGAAEAYARPR